MKLKEAFLRRHTLCYGPICLLANVLAALSSALTSLGRCACTPTVIDKP